MKEAVRQFGKYLKMARTDSSLHICGRYSHHLVFQNHSLLTFESLLPLNKSRAS